MEHSRFPYASEKFSAARAILMLPFPEGEAAAIAAAFHECHLGLDKLPAEQLDEAARDWINTLRGLMSTDEISDPQARGTWTLKAERLSEDEKSSLSRVVDELAHWFRRHELR